MKYRLLNWLACPDCGQFPLSVVTFSKKSSTKSDQEISKFLARGCDFWCAFEDREGTLGYLSDLRLECTDFDLRRSTWEVWAENTDYIVNQSPARSACQGAVNVPASGVYEVHVTGIPANGLEFELDGQVIGIAEYKTDNLRNDICLGVTEVTRGKHEVSLISKGCGGVNYITNIKLKPVLESSAGGGFDCLSCMRVDISEAILKCTCGRWFPVREGLPFLLPASLRDPEQEKQFLDSHTEKLKSMLDLDLSDSKRAQSSDRYKRAEINIAKSSPPSGFFDAQYQMPFDSTFPAQSMDRITRFVTAVPQLSCRVGDVILDLGVGSAWTSEWLARMGFEVLAMDICEDYLRKGMERMGQEFVSARSIHLFVGDVEKIPLRGRAARGILCYDSFHHIYNRGQAIVEFNRVLRSGGVVVFAEPASGHQAHPKSVWVSKRYGILEKEVTLDEVKRYCQGTDLTKIELKKFDIHNYDIIIAQKRGLREFTTRNPDILQAFLELKNPLRRIGKGESFNLKITASNEGNTTWLSSSETGRGTVSVGVRLYDHTYTLLDENFGRTRIPKDVYPGQEVELELVMQAPNKSGNYILEIDMLDEGIMWFEDYEFNPLYLKIKTI